jgi:hypothetical protein
MKVSLGNLLRNNCIQDGTIVGIMESTNIVRISRTIVVIKGKRYLPHHRVRGQADEDHNPQPDADHRAGEPRLQGSVATSFPHQWDTAATFQPDYYRLGRAPPCVVSAGWGAVPM